MQLRGDRRLRDAIAVSSGKQEAAQGFARLLNPRAR